MFKREMKMQAFTPSARTLDASAAALHSHDVSRCPKKGGGSDSRLLLYVSCCPEKGGGSDSRMLLGWKLLCLCVSCRNCVAVVRKP